MYGRICSEGCLFTRTARQVNRNAHSSLCALPLFCLCSHLCSSDFAVVSAFVSLTWVSVSGCNVAQVNEPQLHYHTVSGVASRLFIKLNLLIQNKN